MASVYDKVPELGGIEADRRSVRHALALQQHLHNGAQRQRWEATVIVSIMRLLFVGTAISAALKEQAGQENEGVRWVAITLPLLLGIMTTIYATYRPIQKFAALKSAAAEIESEIFRFRTRTRPYYASKSTVHGKGHRSLFASACERILSTHLTGDVRVGATRFADAEKWLLNPVLPVKDVEEGILTQAAGAQQSRAAPRHSAGQPSASSDRAAAPSSSGVWRTPRDVTSSRSSVADDVTSMLSAEEYTRSRVLHELRLAQSAAPRISRQLKLLQLLVTLGAAVMVVFQSELPLWTPVVLASISTFEFVISYQQLESTLPAVNATAVAILRVLVWWDGLSLIQQRMPASKDRLVDVVETALVMQHQGFVQGAIANLGKDLPELAPAGDEGGGKAKPKGITSKVDMSAMV